MSERYPPQNHPAFVALGEEMERVKQMEGGVEFLVDLFSAIAEIEGLIIVDKAEPESIRREERERILKLRLPIAESLEGQNADVRHGYGMAIDHWARAIRALDQNVEVISTSTCGES